VSEPWKCIGCGKPSPERKRVCECPSSIVHYRDAAGKTVTGWKVDQTYLPAELYDPSEVRQHVGWLKVFIDGMTAENWRDMRLRCARQLAELSAALNPE